MEWIDDYKLWVAEHRLQIDNVPAPFRATPNVSGRMKPEIIVLHETAGRLDPDSSVNWLCNKNAKASAHIVIDREGKITQLAPFNIKTWHAGSSNYMGRRYVNNFGIGIELVGPGQMKAGRLGHARAWFGEEYPIAELGIEKIETEHHGEGWWMPFTDPQIRASIALCKVLIDVYGLTDITTHWAISPGRKVDPNPTFPIHWVRKLALSEGAGPMGKAQH